MLEAINLQKSYGDLEALKASGLEGEGLLNLRDHPTPDGSGQKLDKLWILNRVILAPFEVGIDDIFALGILGIFHASGAVALLFPDLHQMLAEISFQHMWNQKYGCLGGHLQGPNRG